MGDWGHFFKVLFIYFYLLLSYILIKIIPHSPQKSQKALKALTFSWGIFSKMPRKKAPKKPPSGVKSPHKAKNTPQGISTLRGVVIFILTNILLQGLYLHSQSKELEI